MATPEAAPVTVPATQRWILDKTTADASAGGVRICSAADEEFCVEAKDMKEKSVLVLQRRRSGSYAPQQWKVTDGGHIVSAWNTALVWQADGHKLLLRKKVSPEV